MTLTGDLGAGKTTLVKGIAYASSRVDPDIVVSPTFTYLNQYGIEEQFCHFDLYRVKSKEQFLALGFDEYLIKPYICCIEWPQFVLPILPSGTLHVSIEYTGKTKRSLTINKEP